MAERTGLILAGGKGERLGQYKATALLGGEPLIHRPLRALSELSDEVIIAHGRREHGAILRSLSLEAMLVDDDEQGPLAGILTALTVARGRWVLVAPCDAPFVSRELYEELLSRSRGIDGSLPRLHGRTNPVIAVYHRSSLLRVGQNAVAQEERSITKVLSSLRLNYVEEERLREMPYGLNCLLDVDTPADLERARQVLEG